MSDLRTLVDSWLDAELGADRAPDPQPATTRAAVRAALGGARQQQAHRRTWTAVAAAAAVVAAVASTVMVTAGGNGDPRTQAPATTSSTSPTPTASPMPSARAAAAALTVTYPTRGGGRRVTWPAPASGLPWFVADPSVPGGGPGGPATEGSRGLLAALHRAIPGAVTVADPDTIGETGGAAVMGVVQGVATAYTAQVVTPTGASASGQTTWTVSATRGGITATPVVYDVCGRWPRGEPGLGIDEEYRSAHFEAYGGGKQTCTLVEGAGREPIAHFVIVPKPMPELPRVGIQAAAFTVRPDGTAVSAEAWTAPGTPSSAVKAVQDRLDRLVTSLPYPETP
jgi:hypothetical protein